MSDKLEKCYDDLVNAKKTIGSNKWIIIALSVISASFMGYSIYIGVNQPNLLDNSYDDGFNDGIIIGNQTGYEQGIIYGDLTFQLNITVADFYVMDNDTLVKNYSYYIHGLSINGIRFREEEWEVTKDLNSTEWQVYAQNNIYFMEQSVFGILDSSSNESISTDNSEFITRHLPIIVIANYEIYIHNNDETLFMDSIFGHLMDEFFLFDIEWNDYPYKSIDKTQDIDIKFLGCSYNFTSLQMDKLFIEFNGIEKAVAVY